MMIPALVAILSAGPAAAACPLELDGNWAHETAAQARQAVCLQAELNARLLAEQRQAQLKADYELKLMLIELEQRLKQDNGFSPFPR